MSWEGTGGGGGEGGARRGGALKRRVRCRRDRVWECRKSPLEVVEVFGGQEVARGGVARTRLDMRNGVS